ncbi:hypothetical protein [Clostridium folliculivorans]|uniref:DUF3784 domain-containing protein n=1 Tax=Clostridium folliculivorans TaxID=2886038 RepID=A0A9W5Y216_9CLOT|nr:hypothetical protein [Clostridium folliculivorans]GKU25183.1 hypothetical protein CFOLD11_20090 [Clostridium folliculivorans]GKU31281.1 hypothetical protein CFB3_33880 [Clostridium folliculivorans]
MKVIILNILVLIILSIGIASIYLGIMKPTKLFKLDIIKLNGKNYVIKDNKGFIKYNQKIYVCFGIACSILSSLSLLKVIVFSSFCIGIGFTVATVGLVNSVFIKKFAHSL